LDEDGVAGLDAAAGKQHPVRSQPRRGQAGGLLERELRGLRDEIRERHGNTLGERALVLLGQQRAARIERLVPAPVRRGDDTVHDDVVAVLVDARRVGAEDHRQLLLAEADAAERPDVVVVQRGGPDGDDRPAVGNVGLRDILDAQPVQGSIGVERDDAGREHEGMIAYACASCSCASCRARARTPLKASVELGCV
jgi:hypothetical protein